MTIPYRTQWVLKRIFGALIVLTVVLAVVFPRVVDAEVGVVGVGTQALKRRQSISKTDSFFIFLLLCFMYILKIIF